MLQKKGLLGKENVLETVVKFVKMLWKQFCGQKGL